MKVLFLSQRVPYPPDRGDRITTWHFLSHLLARGADVRVGCLAEEDRDAAAVDHLRGLVREVRAPRIHRGRRKVLSLTGLLTGRSLTEVFFRCRELQRAVDAWIAADPPDLCYVYSSSMAQYVLRHAGPVRLMQFAELDSDKWRQYAAHARGPAAWIFRREARALLAFEARVARAFDASAVVSDVERDLFVERIPGVTPTVLPNGVDVDHFTSAGDERREPHTAVFTGVMDYEPNVQGVLWFVAACWPQVRTALPDAKLLIVGSRPVEAIQRLHGHDGIEVTGRVPEIPPYLDRAAVAVAPLHLARGVQNKVLEAMSASLPVVASSKAAQGLGPVGDDALVVADSAADTTAAVLRLLGDPVAARAMGRRAAAHVRAHFRWEHMFARLDALLAEHGL